MASQTNYDDILKQLNDPGSIASGGSYGEGQIGNIHSLLDQAKEGVLAGKINVNDYSDAVNKAIQFASQQVGSIAGKGSKAAGAVNGLWQGLQTAGYVTADAGKWTPQLGFSRQEWAKVPESVLPSQTDVDKGIFDPGSVPFSRLAPNTGGTSPQTPTDGGQFSTLPLGGNNPNGLPTFTPTTPANIDLTGARGQAELEAQRQAGELQNAALAQYQTKQQGLSSLAQSLADNEQKQFGLAIPTLAEQANTSGIYRSTGFGEALARQYASLDAQRQNQLATLGYGATTDYANSLGDIANTATGLQTGGLGRSNSLSDLIMQQNFAGNLASQQINAARANAPSGKTQNIATGAQAAGGIGTAIGSAKTAV